LSRGRAKILRLFTNHPGGLPEGAGNGDFDREVFLDRTYGGKIS
jgi:hypothetical protein